jgi:N-carbamoylputrescine amidase
MSSKLLKVALIQQSCADSKEANIKKTCQLIKEAAQQEAELVLLQELHLTKYFCQTEDVNNFDLAETIPGPSSSIFANLAKELQIVLVTSLFEKRAAGLYHNTAVVFEKDGSIAGTYRKMHIPDDPAYYEKFYFTPGDLGFKPINTSLGKLGILVCWDQWYPEAARLMALNGAELLIYPTAIGWTPSDSIDEKERQKDAWIISQRAHAIANGIPVISINRVGYEEDPSKNTDGLQFWGSSFIAGPQGEIIKIASIEKEEIIIENINLQKSEDVRRIWPFLRDRRIDEYSELSKRWID